MRRNWFSEYVDGEVPYEELEKMASEGKFREWEYEAFDLVETGYEDVEDDLAKYTAEKYQKSSEAEQKQMIEDVLEIYRSRDVFPIKYFNELGMMNEVEKVINCNLEFEGDTIMGGSGIGTALCNFLFPNLFDTPSLHDVDKKGAATCIEKWNNDEYMRRAIGFCFSYKNGSPTPTSMFAAIRLVGSSPTNFNPARAKALYERLCPPGGTIWDMSTGFGGRLLGCLTSKNNYRYVGTDPNVESMWHTHQLAELVESVTGREDSYELHCVGSEVFRGKPESIDFAFTSPPYFNLEIYSDDPTQCYNKFPELDGWLEGFVRGTIKNVAYMLKRGCLYAINIADFKDAGKDVDYVDEWCRISAEEGMPLFDRVYLGVPARAGSAQQKAGEVKKENILVFKKL